jgi:hypothetical protein
LHLALSIGGLIGEPLRTSAQLDLERASMPAIQRKIHAQVSRNLDAASHHVRLAAAAAADGLSLDSDAMPRLRADIFQETRDGRAAAQAASNAARDAEREVRRYVQTLRAKRREAERRARDAQDERSKCIWGCT